MYSLHHFDRRHQLSSCSRRRAGRQRHCRDAEVPASKGSGCFSPAALYLYNAEPARTTPPAALSSHTSEHTVAQPFSFCSDFSDIWETGFSAQHVSALQAAASSLQHLDISDCDVPLTSLRLNNCSISVVGSLLNLTRLHILHQVYLDFAPLQQLSCLQQLLLSSLRMDCDSCCHEVLESSKGQLQMVQLWAKFWSNRTYQALEGLTCLRTLDMAVCALSTGQAQILGDLTQPQQVRFALIDCCEDNVNPCTMQALTAGRASWLQMRDAPYSLLHHLSTMIRLTSLDTIDPVSFTGFYMELQPCVKKLTLQNVPHLSTEGLQHMISMLPALKYLYFEGGQISDRWMLSQDVSLAVLAQARYLEEISLRGLFNLSLKQVQELELAVRSQGEIGLAQSAVDVVMPQQICPDDTVTCIAVGSSCPQIFSRMSSNETVESAWRLHLHQVNVRHRVIVTVGVLLTAYAVKKVSCMSCRAGILVYRCAKAKCR